ncbi:MAG: hypothetical protein CW346_18970 [Bacillaceae bacterium]|nr:hypothetical protein [Bacillaceae bacterium]
MVRLLAEACGRDPGPLVTVAKYERNPQSVLLDFADSFAFADRCVQLLDEWNRHRRTELIARLEAGEPVSTDEILRALKEEDPVARNLRQSYYLYRDYAFDTLELIANWSQRSMGAVLLEDGRFDQSVGLPEEVRVALRPRGPGLTKERRFRDLVARLSELMDVPEEPILAAIAAAKAVKDPDFDVADFVQTYLRPSAHAQQESPES